MFFNTVEGGATPSAPPPPVLGREGCAAWTPRLEGNYHSTNGEGRVQAEESCSPRKPVEDGDSGGAESPSFYVVVVVVVV